jgi:hypothetical protein
MSSATTGGMKVSRTRRRAPDREISQLTATYLVTDGPETAAYQSWRFMVRRRIRR